MAYDAGNRMTLVNEPFGATLTMAYDNLGNRTQVQDLSNGQLAGGFSALVPIPNGRGRHRAAPFGLGP